MKRLVQLSSIILLTCAGLFMFTRYAERSAGLTEENTLRIYNWGEYIDPELIKQFEAETGYAVSYETFDSNEAMYTKVKQGGTHYDLIVPSEYMAEKMIAEEMLLELDPAEIVGLDHIGAEFLDQPFDPGNRYTVPYFWGTLGVIYNANYIEAGEITTWADLWQPQYQDQILFIDGAREMLGIGLQKNGHSLNTTDAAVLRQTAEDLKALMPNAKALLADEIKMYMIQEEAPLAVTFSGEAADMMWENEALQYIIPEEGSNLWFDNMVIPAQAQNIAGAYAFINFMLRPEIAAQNADYVGFSTPNQDAMAILDEAVTGDTNFYPTAAQLQNMEVYQSLPQDILELYNNLYVEIKMAR